MQNSFETSRVEAATMSHILAITFLFLPAIVGLTSCVTAYGDDLSFTVGKDGEPVKTIPLEDGFFEMQLPKVLFEDNPKSITLNWIDFYR